MSTTSLNPLAMTLEDAARLLSSLGTVASKPVTVEQLQADIDLGAPAYLGPDAKPRINLIHYTAWLLREIETK